MMNTIKLRDGSLMTVTVLAVALMGGTLPKQMLAQTEGQKVFTTSQEAVEALIGAVRAGDSAQLQAILGPGSEEIISSGDDVADKSGRDRFVEKYEAKHSLTESSPNQRILSVGKDSWPLPIPLVKANGKWYFDGAAGKEEILYRRIGRNELGAIQVCKGVVAAQRDYAAAGHDGNPAGSFAQRFISAPGKQNGLFWEAPEGDPPSPAGPFLARASAEGYDTSGQRTPYHGYYYRLLKAQGSSAKGGAKSYVVDGKMTGGFALIAFPAEYRSSGVMTFLVNQSGVLYQRDLGEKTADIASKITEYDPDKNWKRVNP